MIRPFLHPFPSVSRFPSERRLSDFRIFGLPDSTRSRSGSALVIVLGLLSVLMLMGVAFSVTMRTERGGASNMRHAAMARHTLDSAIARTMSDLEAQLNIDDDILGDLVVLASGEDLDTTTVNLLSHEIAKHLPSDQLAAALYTKARWLPIYGDVRISDAATDPTSEDSPVGRYAYIVLNDCGYLDPNVVGREDRGFGISPKEIYPGKNSGGQLLEINKNGTVNAFLSQRDKDGHYVTMRDFLRKSVTNIVWNPRFRPGSNVANAIATNCFAIGSMAVDDPTPPVELDDGTKYSYATNSRGDKKPHTEVPYRLPKCALVDAKGKLLDPKFVNGDKKQEIADAFAGAFASTWAADGKAIPEYLAYKGGGKDSGIPFEQAAMHALLDWLDDDVYPGGTEGRKSETEADGYLPKYEWSHFPCVEPIPMLDNLLALGYLEFDGFARKKVTNESGQLVDGPATAAVWKVSIAMPKNSSFRYVGLTVPEAAAGDYDSEWSFFGIGPDLPPDADRGFQSVVNNALGRLLDSLEGKKLKGTMHVDKGISGSKRRGEYDDGDLEDVISLTLPMSMNMLPEETRMNPSADNPEHTRYAVIPDEFGLFLMAVGRVYKGGNLLQIAPAPRNNDPDDEHNYVYLPLILRKKDMLRKADEDTLAFLGGAFCLDPMFAYNFDSWIPTIDFRDLNDNSPMSDLRRELSQEGAAQRIVNSGDINPLTRLYLSNPYEMFGGQPLFRILTSSAGHGDATVGGISDVMWANPDGIYDDSPGVKSSDGIAALAFYIDPKEDDETQPECFNRVGQLGFLPIGTYRTIALLDGFYDGKRVPRQRVLDYFTMYAPRPKGEGTKGTDEKHPGDPVKSALFTSRLNINPPRTAYWNAAKKTVETDDYNLLPMTAALSGCPLREWATGTNRMPIPWDLAEELADAYAENLDRKDNHAKDEDVINGWNSDGVAHDISILGRCGKDNPSLDDLEKDPSWDSILRQTKLLGNQGPICDFDREGIVRNTAGMFTARQQLFTLLLKADSFTPKFGYEKDAAHGTSLASVQAIVHVWRDPEPVRDAAGIPIRDKAGNAIHPYVVLDVYQF